MVQGSVCIIGGGASGLIALEEMLDLGLDAVLFEARAEVGGAWLLSDDAGPCEVVIDGVEATLKSPTERTGQADGIGEGPPPPTPMYPSLKTNVPTSLMEYRGRRFPPSVGLFPGPADICSYLQATASDFSERIQLNTRVTRLRYTEPEDGGKQKKWLVETYSTLEPERPPRVAQFDNIIIANGHYSTPWIPKIPGLSSWDGELLHSRWYRMAAAFEGKTVLVVGNGASGYDATREIADLIHQRRVADPTASLPKIYQSSRSPSALGIPFDDPTAPDWAREISTFPPIAKVEGRLIVFEDGRTLQDVDCILFATGYLFSFPFAHSSDAPWNRHPLTKEQKGGLRVHNLDARDLFYYPDPTLALLCLPFLVLPFPLAQVQAHLAASHWSGKHTLSFAPSAIPDDAEESRAALVWGHPKEHDNRDRMLREVGEGQEGYEKWSSVSRAQRDLRAGAKGLRRAVLGY